MATTRWLAAALDYVPEWLEFQMRLGDQPGCAIAIAHRGEIVLDRALGVADAVRRVPLTPRHRFRVASHSKSFTAAGVMRLREARRVRLDTAVGKYVPGLHRTIAETTLRELLSHGAGISRDGPDSGQWALARPFLNAHELARDLARPRVIDRNARLKYSNHGYALLGRVIEEVTGEAFGPWISKHVIAAAGLRSTYPDMPVARTVPVAHGHTMKMTFGERCTLGRDLPTHGMAAATGFVSTARDLVTFYQQLDPAAPRSFLGVPSRRYMTRFHRHVPGLPAGREYGLGIARGRLADWRWFGHSGSFPGYLTRTAVVPSERLTISLLTNAVDGPAQLWMDGVLGILQTFAKRGAPRAAARRWKGRWWSLWGATDLVAIGDRVLLATPALAHPFVGASELSVRGDRGTVVAADGYATFGETAALMRSRGKATELRIGGGTLLPEKELRARTRARLRKRR
jgi:CubicO group peptidase (beta-lactamase class C family)